VPPITVAAPRGPGVHPAKAQAGGLEERQGPVGGRGGMGGLMAASGERLRAWGQTGQASSPGS